MRIVSQHVSFMHNRYYLFYRGDEILLKAKNDEDAIKEGNKLIFDMECQ
jgi:hypothetical protein